MRSGKLSVWDVKWSPDQRKFIFRLDTTVGKARTKKPVGNSKIEPKAMIEDLWFDERVPDVTSKFHEGDLVEWNDTPENPYSQMREPYGEGPFIVKVVYDITDIPYDDQFGRKDPYKDALHTQHVHIELCDGKVHRFDASYFRKIKETAN